MSADPIDRLVLFGATGDLTGRYLLPALAQLIEAGHAPSDLEVVGAARADLDDDGFRQLARERLDEHADDVPDAARNALLERLRYRTVDLADASSVGAVMGTSRPTAAYLALPPATYPTVLESLGAAGMPAGSRIVVEKPFGEDLDSARTLNRLVAEVVGDAGEDAIFRVDHVLGMPSAHNLLVARLANPMLEQVWNSTHVEQVDLLWEETLALEGRAGFFDATGALLDVVQNHVVQVLCLVAMEPPDDESADELCRRKADVLRSVRPLTPDEVAEHSRRARYTAGTLAPPPEGAGTEVPNYVDEEGVDPDHDTETFAEVVLAVDTPRWQGTRFRLRAGKALSRRHQGVVLHLRPSSDGARNQLRFGIDGPHTIEARLTGGRLGPPEEVAPFVLRGEPPDDELPAYAHVLLAALQGDRSRSVSGEEAELAWRIVDPIVKAWRSGDVPMEEYAAGSDGPPD